MLRHVVMFKWADDVDDAHIAAVSAGLDELPSAIPQIADYRHGRNAGINPDTYDYVVVGDFATSDDYLVYRDDPTHRKLIADMIQGRVAGRAAIQYEIPD